MSAVSSRRRTLAILLTNTMTTMTHKTAPAGAANTQVTIETYRIIGGKFQLRFKRGWDGALYIEVGDDWRNDRGFGHPSRGRHEWELRGLGLHQKIPGAVNCHYPISVSEAIKRELLAANR